MATKSTWDLPWTMVGSDQWFELSQNCTESSQTGAESKVATIIREHNRH